MCVYLFAELKLDLLWSLSCGFFYPPPLLRFGLDFFNWIEKDSVCMIYLSLVVSPSTSSFFFFLKRCACLVFWRWRIWGTFWVSHGGCSHKIWSLIWGWNLVLILCGKLVQSRFFVGGWMKCQSFSLLLLLLVSKWVSTVVRSNRGRSWRIKEVESLAPARKLRTKDLYKS